MEVTNSLELQAGNLSRCSGIIWQRNGWQEGDPAMQKCVPWPAADSDMQNSHEKDPRQGHALTWNYSSPSSNSVSLCTTTLVTDMSGCCSLASRMAWASACQGQERAQSAEEQPPPRAANTHAHWYLGRHLRPRWFHCFTCESRWFEMDSVIFENAPHFPKVPISPVHFQITIHVEETL